VVQPHQLRDCMAELMQGRAVVEVYVALEKMKDEEYLDLQAKLNETMPVFPIIGVESPGDFSKLFSLEGKKITLPTRELLWDTPAEGIYHGAIEINKSYSMQV